VHSGREIVTLVHEVGADTVAVCGSASAEPGELRRLAWQLEGTGVDLVVAPQLTDIAGPRVHIRPVEGLPLLYVESPPCPGSPGSSRNLMDRVVAGLALVILSPVIGAIAIAIRMSDKGPVFFRQRRVGREGKTFSVWKFRTMYVDAEDRLAALVDQNETDGLLFKIKNDPRITPLAGSCGPARWTQLPQFINVLVGEMSLVGPRPLPAEDGTSWATYGAAAGTPRNHRALAGVRPLRPVLGRRGTPRPLLRRQLVADLEPHHHLAYGRRSPPQQRCVLADLWGTFEVMSSPLEEVPFTELIQHPTRTTGRPDRGRVPCACAAATPVTWC